MASSGDKAPLNFPPLSVGVVKSEGNSKLQLHQQQKERHHPLEERQQQERDELEIKRQELEQQPSAESSAMTENTPSNQHSQIEEASSMETGSKQQNGGEPLSSSATVLGTESGEGTRAQEAAESEFARNVRGTSTPIDLSPTHSPNQSLTFDVHDNTNLEPKTEVGGSGSVEVEVIVTSPGEDARRKSSLDHKTLKRENALDPIDEA